MPDKDIIKRRIDEIEAEMKRAGFWSDTPLPQAAYDFHQAFAMDAMTFTQWLQFVFVPRVNEIIRSGAQFPSGSQVGAQAVRELDSYEDASRLVSLLCEFDSLIEAG